MQVHCLDDGGYRELLFVVGLLPQRTARLHQYQVWVKGRWFRSFQPLPRSGMSLTPTPRIGAGGLPMKSLG